MSAPSVTSSPTRPLPIPSPASVPFWQGTKRHELLLPLCHSCGRLWFPPAKSCPQCLSNDIGWQRANGNGKIFSFVVFHRFYDRAFESAVPYVVAIVELAEGPRMLTNIVGVPPESMLVDMPVSVVYEDVTTEITIPKFAPLAASQGRV